MAPSTAPISDSDIVEVIVDLQAAGGTITAERVYQEMRVRRMPCRRSTVQAVVRAWRQQQQVGDEVPAPVAPPPLGVDQPRHELAIVLSDSGPDNAEMAYVPPPRPVCPLLARREGCAQRTAAVDRRRRALAQDEQELAHDVAALRNDLREAARLTRQVRQLLQQATQPAFLMQADAVATFERVRQELAALVGQAEVARVLADAAYTPWWLEG